mmetsp:Transcript_100761/g.325206  ORF Transcript_100761/g.325206 Transcript_100761/m.325206 type:complete len:147 (+) Transcript_100761:78-518(+)
MEPSTAERLWLQMPPERVRPPNALEMAALREECSMVEAWVGPSAVSHKTCASLSSTEGIWILRRMWLCPDFAAHTEHNEDCCKPCDCGKAEDSVGAEAPLNGPVSPVVIAPSRKRPAADCGSSRVLRKRPAAVVHKRPCGSGAIAD